MKKLWNKYGSIEGQEAIFTPTGVNVDFNLTYRNLIVGVLRLRDGEWCFKYSEEFKQQTQIKPLTDFPDVNKVYASKELYPFFVERIPGMGQT